MYAANPVAQLDMVSPETGVQPHLRWLHLKYMHKNSDKTRSLLHSILTVQFDPAYPSIE